MGTALRVIVDQLISEVPGGVGRYTEELTRALIVTAPRGCDVVGLVSAATPEEYARVTNALPGLADLEHTLLRRRELSAAWQMGMVGTAANGMVHATSMLAPLVRRRRAVDGDTHQVAVTIHDVVPWTHPETLTPRGAAWHRAMGKRAAKFADAIVVPTHAVASELTRHLGVADRIRVIGGAVSDKLVVPTDADERAAALGLPQKYVLAVGTLEPRKGLVPLIEAMARADAPDLPLVIAGPPGWGEMKLEDIAADKGLAEERLIVLGRLSDSDLALVIDRADVFVYPSLAEGFGLPVLEAMHLGTPVVHSDAPALVEVSDESAVVVPRDDAAGYPERLARAIDSVLRDSEFAHRLVVRGLDRSRAFSWRDSAEKVWQLHADL